jgi:hypothetical protein
LEITKRRKGRLVQRPRWKHIEHHAVLGGLILLPSHLFNRRSGRRLGGPSLILRLHRPNFGTGNNATKVREVNCRAHFFFENIRMVQRL